jgi:16S rRNA G966 N2-methylase RsmD
MAASAARLWAISALLSAIATLDAASAALACEALSWFVAEATLLELWAKASTALRTALSWPRSWLSCARAERASAIIWSRSAEFIGDPGAS